MEASTLRASAGAGFIAAAAAPAAALRRPARGALPGRQRGRLRRPPRPLSPASLRLRAPDARRRVARVTPRTCCRTSSCAPTSHCAPTTGRWPRAPGSTASPTTAASTRCAAPRRSPPSSRTRRPATCTIRSASSTRRDDLRRLVTDLGRLPEQQRSALLMRELEGLSYAELAAALGCTLPAVKSLLVRARIGLAESHASRDAACSEIRSDLAATYDRRVRASAHARRHMRDCADCRSFRAAMQGSSREMDALTPSSGPLVWLTKLLGLGGSGAAGSGLAGGTAGGGAAGLAGGGGIAGGGGAGGARGAAAARSPRRRPRSRSSCAAWRASRAARRRSSTERRRPPSPPHRPPRSSR